MYNAENHLKDLIESTKEQTNKNWEHIIIDDMSTDNSYEKAVEITASDSRYTVIKNSEKKWALRNVVEASRKYQNEDNVIIANLDADDSLCNESTVELLISSYNKNNLNAAWTSHTWDINGDNVSQNWPDQKIDPYEYFWVTSHLKTWRASVMKKICDKNFKDLEGKWFLRGYDQALYLPILHVAKSFKHIDEVCYYYRINSDSIKVRDWNEKSQMDTVRLVRARGFIDDAQGINFK